MTRTELPPRAVPAISALLELLGGDPRAPISAGSVPRAREVHVADSLSGLDFAELRDAERLADLGSGAGLPGLVLAAALPGARVDLIESSSRKCEFLRTAKERTALTNVTVVCERAESWASGQGREAYDACTARALGSLVSVAELASPLLRVGGALLVWRGARRPEEEERLRRAADRLAVETVEVRPMTPYPGSRDRHIHLLRKNAATPEGLPRRPGSAAKRPFGSE